VRARILNLRQHAHPLDDLQGWTEKIHGMPPTTETKFFGPLDDGGLEPEPAEPVAEYRAGDARAGDEHATTAHRSASVSTTEPAATGSASDHNARVAVRLEPTGTMRG
jgi:hypothetical protein